MKRRLLPSPILSVFLFGLWLLLNRSLEVAHILLALVLAWWLPWFSQQLRPVPAPRLKKPWLLVKLFFVVLHDIVISNYNVARVILGRRERREQSGFMTLPLDLRNPYGLAVLSTIINSTPGTVWAEMSPDRSRLMIHVLDLQDEQQWIDTIKNRYERPLRAVFE